jgi:hypothetical protein
MRFYLNGVLAGQNGYEGSFAAISAGADNYLGKSSWSGNAYFRGQLDEVRVWSVARSAVEINADMQQPLRGGEKGLVGLWNFDAGDAADRSLQGRHGQLRGGARCVAAPFPGAGAVVKPSVVQGGVRNEVGVPLRKADVSLMRGETELVSMGTSADGRYALATFGAGSYVLNTRFDNAMPQWADLLHPPLDGIGRQTHGSIAAGGRGAPPGPELSFHAAGAVVWRRRWARCPGTARREAGGWSELCSGLGGPGF